MARNLLIFLILTLGIFAFAIQSFSAEKIPTKILVRVISRDAKVIGSGVGGASIRIADVETRETLTWGKQEGDTGDTDRIMIQPHRRGETLYGTPGAAFFQAKIPLDRLTQIGVYAEAPLAYPQATQRGSKTLTLIPGKHILGEGVIIELNGLILHLLNPLPTKVLKKGEEVEVQAEVKML